MVLLCSDYFMMGHVGSRVDVQSSSYLYEKVYSWKNWKWGKKVSIYDFHHMWFNFCQ